MKKVAIIGAGLAGMTAGIYLLENGYDVTIYEKNRYPGGLIAGWYRMGQFIDGCFHWMIGSNKNTKLGKIWRHINAIRNEEIVSLDSFFTAKLDDEYVTFYNDFDLLEKELYRVSKNDDEEIKNFMNALKSINGIEIRTELAYELSDPQELFQEAKQVLKARNYMKITLEEYALKFNSEILRFAFLNSPIDKKHFVFYFLQTMMHLCNKNADLPKGGSKLVADSVMSKYESLGGKIVYGANVSKIIIEDETTKGIMVNNEAVLSDYVVSACDVHYTFEKLLDDKYEKVPYVDYDSNKDNHSTYSFYISVFRVKKEIKDDVMMVLKTPEYEVLGSKRDSITIRHYGYDESLMNDGYTVVQVIVPTYEKDYEYLKSLTRKEYNEVKKKTNAFYLDFLKEYYSLDDEEIDLIDSFTPLTYERYVNSYKGTFMTYPFAPKVKRVMREQTINGLKGLILANQWLQFPGGTPVALTSGKFAAQLVMHEDGMPLDALKAI